ncbi:hypothetical protein ACA910_006801 [Epithemia clementina (nom. ined.)]
MSSTGGQRRKPSVGSKDQTRLRIEKMEAEREERRRAMQQRKQQRAAEEKANREAGNPGDVDFIGMVRRWREEHKHERQPYHQSNNDSSSDVRTHPALCICVRKRPLNDKERTKQDHDSITVLNPAVWIHAAKLRVDGITKYLDHTSFQLDYAFDEECDTQHIYETTARPLLEFACQGTGGRATIFAYGQTGSGKTYTMSGIQNFIVQDLFELLHEQNGVDQDDGDWCTLGNCRVVVSFFELYGGCIQDLLNQRQRLKILEDGKGEVVVTGLSERPADDPNELLAFLQEGNEARTTHTTEANDESSRSHAICQIMLRDIYTDKMRGKLSLVDLAGSERGTDTKSHNTQRRAESADINTSLLALKECIRALDRNSKDSTNTSTAGGGKENSRDKHVPYRGSKLTLILKDCFTSANAMTTMIATVSPGVSSVDHSLNTLRYADRIKEQKVGRHNGSNNRNVVIRIKRKGTGVPSAPSKDTNPHIQHGHQEQGADDFDDFDDDFDDENELPAETTLSADEEELRDIVESLLEQEEEILSLHMQNIHENAEILEEEGKMLQSIQQVTSTFFHNKQQVDEYMDALEIVLERKEEMIATLQEKMALFRTQLRREQELSARVAAASSSSQQ